MCLNSNCNFTVLASYCLDQNCIIFLCHHTGFSAATSMFTFVTLIVTLIITCSYGCFGHFKYLSSYKYKVTHDITFAFHWCWRADDHMLNVPSLHKTDAQEMDELENGQSICTLASSEEAVCITFFFLRLESMQLYSQT